MTKVELRQGNTKVSLDAGNRKIRFDYRLGFSRHRSGPLALPESFWLGGQTPWRHFGAERKFLFLFSGRHLHPRQYLDYPFELVIQALRIKPKIRNRNKPQITRISQI